MTEPLRRIDAQRARALRMGIAKANRHAEVRMK